jgi:K+-sensing histidine kinase KdpD
MKAKSRAVVILTILFGYVLLQFLWWEILLVKQNGIIINEKQKLVEITSTNADQLKNDIAILHEKKKMQTIMIVSEGTVFLLLLLFGIYKIKQAHDKENLLNDQQSNFFLSITHELKTPITATKLQLQTLQKQNLDQEKRDELIVSALRETERLNMLIDNVLIASRLNTGEFIFNKEKTAVHKFVRSILERYYKKEITAGYIFLNEESNVSALIDPQAFPSVITNLVDNALKYSFNEKRINVEIRRENNKALISVSDLGCGIPDKEKSKVFKKFYRAGNEETRRSKGTGLGLYIVEFITRRHGGRISVRDNKPVGSVFEVELDAV